MVIHSKLQSSKSYELVARHLKEQILSGELQPGQKLPSVVDLAASLGVGRSSLREALTALKAMGYLNIRQGGGTYVSAVLPAPAEEQAGGAAAGIFHNAESLRELLEVRKLLETGSAALAARNRSSEHLALMQTILADMESALQSQDETAGERADVEFHLAVAQASGNALLLQLMDSLAARMQETVTDTRKLWFYEEQATASRLLEEHRSIYAAIAGTDAAMASSLMKTHLEKVESVLIHALGTSYQ